MKVSPCIPGKMAASTSLPAVDLKGCMVLPTFIDMHTHIGRGSSPRKLAKRYMLLGALFVNGKKPICLYKCMFE